MLVRTWNNSSVSLCSPPWKCRTKFYSYTYHCKILPIREWNHNTKDRKYAYNSTSIFNTFVHVVNSQSQYNDNKNGMINAIPLIA